MPMHHIFVSPDPDDPDPSLVRPSNWNDAHLLEQQISGNTNGALTLLTATNIVLAALGIASIGITGDTIGISVPPGGGGGDGYNILAAGTQTANTTGTVLFQNANGLTFGMNNSSVITASYTVPTQSVQPGIQSISAGTTRATTGEVVWSNSNGISFGLNGQTMTASYTVPTQSVQPGIQSISAGTTRATTGEVVWSNSNGISFGLNGNTLTASYTVPAQTVQPGIQSVSAGTTRVTTGEIVWSNSNGISFGINGQTMTASYTVPTQSVQTVGLYALSQTTAQSSSSTVDARSFSVQGAGGVSVGMSAGALVISGPTAGGGGAVNFSAGTTSADLQSVVFSNSNGVSFGLNAGTITATVQPGAAAGIAAVAAGTQQATSGTVTFVNSNGISFGMSGSSQITATYTVPTQSVQPGIQSISAGTTRATTGEVVWSNSNGISFGLNGNTLTASYTVPTQSVQPGIQSISAGTTRATTGEVVWSNSNGISFGLNGNTLTASYTVPTQTVQPGIQSISAGTTRATTGEVVWSNSNGISFGLNGNTLTASYTVPSTAGLLSAVNLSAGTTSQNLSAFVFSNSNGLSFGLNGSTVTASYTVPTQSVQTQSNVQGIIAGTQTGRTGDILFQNSNGISFGMSNSSVVTASYTVPTQTVQPGIQSISAGTTRATTGEVVWSNSNGISFGLNGNTLTASYTVPTQSAQTIGLYASSQTTGQSSSSTVDARSFTLLGQGGVSVGMSNGSFIISGATGGGGGGGSVNFSAGTTSSNLQSVVFSNSNGVSFGLNGGTITATVNPGAAAGIAALNNSNTTYTSGTVQLSEGGGALTIASGTGQRLLFSVPQTSSLVGASGINVSVNGSTISVYQSPGSYYANMQVLPNTQTQTVGQSTSVVFPFDLKEVEQPGLIRLFHTVSLASTSFASTANTSYSYNQAETYNLVLYTRGTGASSLSLYSIASTSASVQMSIRLSRNTTNNISVTHGLTFPVSNGTSSLSFSYAATNSSDQFSTTHMTALSGMKMWDTQFTNYLGGQQYWLAYGVSTTQTTQQTANLSAARLLHSHIGATQANNTLGQFGVANAASVQWVPGHGSFSTAGGGTTSAFPISAVSSSASHVLPYLMLMRIA